MGETGMPVKLVHAGTSHAANFEFARSAVAITALPDGRFIVADYSAGLSRVVRVGASGPVLEGQWVHEAAPRAAFDVTGSSGGLPPALVQDLLGAWDAGTRSGTLGFLGQGGQQAQAASLLAARLDGQDYLVAAASDGQGLSIFRLGPGQTVQTVTSQADTAEVYLRNISDLAVIEIAGVAHVFAASASEHGLSGLRVTAGGELVPGPSLGREDSLPVQTITALAPADVAGRPFLIVAAAGSASLTVVSVGADGVLGVSDHVIDGLSTRFDGVTHLEVIAHDGHVFVLAAGRDAGLSLFRLTAEGRLVHLDTLADGVAFALDGVSGLAAQARAGGLDILVTAAGEAGLSLFRVDLGTPGLVLRSGAERVEGSSDNDMLSLSGGAGVLDGQAGEDILSDGIGRDTLIGGAGADLFVLMADGQRDVIADFTLGEDRLDLSLWPMLRNIGQIAFEPTSTGAVLRFGAEELDLRSHDGAAFAMADLPAMLTPLLSHFDITLGPLQAAAPEPPPVADKSPDPAPVDAPNPVVPPAPVSQTLVGSDGHDLIEGGSGDDILGGKDGNDTLRGNAGHDRIAGAAGDDLIEGGLGDDNIGGGPGSDTIHGQGGDDTIGGGQDDDSLSGGDGQDVISGGPGNDLLEGGPGNDRLAGSFERDTVFGGDGDDMIGGGPGRDLLEGGAGDDQFGGGEANDTILGGSGADFLAGGGRHDLLDGGIGRDTLNGGAGDDTMSGGAGADLFVFNDLVAGERDAITDFQVGEDRMRLAGVDGRGLLGRFQALDIFDRDAGAVVRYGDHEILLEDVAAGSLSLEDFIFL